MSMRTARSASRRAVAVLAHGAVAAFASGCVGATTPPPEHSTTTLTAADVGPSGDGREVSASRARRRLEVAAREIGVLEQALSRRSPEDARPSRDLVRRAERLRLEIERELSGLERESAATSPSGRAEDLEARLDELDALLEQARK